MERQFKLAQQKGQSSGHQRSAAFGAVVPGSITGTRTLPDVPQGHDSGVAVTQPAIAEGVPVIPADVPVHPRAAPPTQQSTS